MTAEPVITAALLREAANTLTRIVSSGAFRRSRIAGALQTSELRASMLLGLEHVLRAVQSVREALEAL